MKEPSNSPTIKTMIIDDEPLAIEGLSMRLQQFPSVQIVSRCLDSDQALMDIVVIRPDLVFLDIRMPIMNGFQILEKIKQVGVQIPLIVFVSAYNEFDISAVNGFESNAIDYLMKPIVSSKLSKCIAKIETILNERSGVTVPNITDSTAATNEIESTYSSIKLRTGNDWMTLSLNQILWIEFAGDYICIHCDDGVHIVRITMKHVATILKPPEFCRISEEVLVNVSHIVFTMPAPQNQCKIDISDGQQLMVANQYRDELLSVL